MCKLCTIQKLWLNNNLTQNKHMENSYMKKTPQINDTDTFRMLHF